MTRDELIQWLRAELPKLLQEDPMLRAQVVGVLSEVLVTKGELIRFLEELRAMRVESERRFEEMDRRFAAMVEELRAMRVESERRFEEMDRRFEEADRRFAAMVEELRAMRADFDRWVQIVQQEFADLRARVAEVHIGLGSLGGRMGRGLEDVIRQVIEKFSGSGPLKATQLILVDEAGEVRHPGARVEFDALVTNGRKFLVEVKNYVEADEVWSFYQKARFAEAKLGEAFEKVLIAPAATRSAVELARTLGITCYTFRIVEAQGPEE